jgi:vanillate monooxygenase ferredoxin subunit
VQGKVSRLSVKVAQTRVEAEDIISYQLVHSCKEVLPSFEPGAHIGVFLPSGLVRQYSLANDPASTGHYLIAVKREAQGRGGSIEMQDAITVGSEVAITTPINNFSIFPSARRHLFIAGGIGITPIISMIRVLKRKDMSWSLHYCARSIAKMAFREDLGHPALAEHTSFYYDDGDPRNGLPITELLAAELTPEAHVYCCGPAGLMEAVKKASKDWPKGSVHFEYFTTSERAEGERDETTFEVELASTGQVFVVPPDKTILTVLEENDVDVPSLCTEGICGTCIVGVLSGDIDHRDHVLDDDAKAANKRIAICCSRARSRRLKLAL